MDDIGYVALSEKVTATFYDDEHEEWTQKTMTVADVLDSVCDDYTVIPSAQPETNCSEIPNDSDTISRQEVIDAVYERIRQIGYENNPLVLSIRQTIRDLPSAQSEIKTEDFEKGLHDMFDHIWDCEIEHPMFQDTVGELMQAVIQLYGRVAQPKHGYWIESHEHVYMGNGVKEWTNWYCSECDAPNDKPTDFCPTCGAKMMEDGEG